LKQTDFDGTFTYSDVIVVSTVAEQKIDLDIYPNPATDRVSLSFDKNLNLGRIEVQLFNLMGELVMNETFEPGENIVLGLATVPSGIYVIQAQIGCILWIAKVLKQ